MGTLCSKENDDILYVIRLKRAIRKYFRYHLGQNEPPSIQYLRRLSSIRNTLKIYNVKETDVFLYENIDDTTYSFRNDSYVEISVIR